MKKLLLINFEKDPDTTYLGLEPQVFDDAVNGTGHLVIGWRLDGRVDVYHQPGLRLNPGKYNIAGKGLAHMVATEMEQAFFEVEDAGVQARYRFQDLQNRRISICIEEKNPKKRKPFGLLAPMGDAASHPSAMPLVLLHDFYFVRQKKTRFEVSIDGRVHKPDTMPLPMDGTGMYFARYSPMPLIATLNPAQNGPVAALDLVEGTEKIEVKGQTLHLEWHLGRPYILSLERPCALHPLRLTFSPAFPDVSALPAGFSSKGAFAIDGHPSTGRISGVYSAEASEAGTVIVSMTPSGGWRPRISKFSLWIIYRAARVFTQWPKTYTWTGALSRQEDGNWHMKSDWQRTGFIMSRS